MDNAHAEELRLEIPGLALAARAWGPADGEPVLALHGWLDNAASFDRLAPLLPRSLRIVALDLPGHGLSQHASADAIHHFIDYVPESFAAADALGWRRFAVVGHSMGGGVGLLMAGCLPERISRLAVIEGLGPLSDPADDIADRLAAFINGRSRSRQSRPHPDLASAMSVREGQPKAPLSREAAALIVGRGTRPVDGGVCWRSDPRLQLQSPMRLTEGQVQAFARRVRCPVQVIIAEDGWPFPERAVTQRLACLSSVEVLRRPGNHHVHINDPEQVAEDVGAFLVGESR